jgi:hypothetical protein
MSDFQPIALNDRWRIIESGERYPYGQWLLQRNKIVKGETIWLSQSYCQTRHGLLTAINEKIVNAHRFYPGGAKSMPVEQQALDRVKNRPERWLGREPEPIG